MLFGRPEEGATMTRRIGPMLAKGIYRSNDRGSRGSGGFPKASSVPIVSFQDCWEGIRMFVQESGRALKPCWSRELRAMHTDASFGPIESSPRGPFKRQLIERIQILVKQAVGSYGSVSLAKRFGSDPGCLDLRSLLCSGLCQVLASQEAARALPGRRGLGLWVQCIGISGAARKVRVRRLW